MIAYSVSKMARRYAHVLRWTVIVTFVIGLGSSLAVAQEDASIRGVVTSADDGTALPNANVVLLSLEGAREGAAATDRDGFFEIRDLDPGEYQIRVSYIGYQTHQDTLSLSSELQTYNVSLFPSEQTLEEVQVEAERGAAVREAGLQTVGVADLQRIPTPGPSGDLAAYLQTLPGVVSVGDRGGQLYIRGGTPSQNLVLVDGLRIIQPFHISNLYSAFPEEVVKSADVHAGGFGAEYMGAISSVIDVSLRQGNMKKHEGSTSISPFLATGRLEGPLRDGLDSYLLMGRRSIIEDVAPSLYGREVPLTFYDLTGRYSLQLEGASCNLTGLRTYDRGSINPDLNLVLSWTNTTIGGRCLLFGEGLGRAIDLSGGYTHFENNAGFPEDPQRSASLRKIYFGLESEQDFLNSTINYGARWEVNTYKYNLDEKFTSLQRHNQSGGALKAFASMEWDVGSRLTLIPSFGTHFTVRRMGAPTYEPRLRLSFRPDGTDRYEVSAAIGKYNQIADGITDERDAGTVFTIWRPSSQSDPLLRALHGILGYRQQIGSSLMVNVEGYYKDLANLPVPEWSPVARFDTETTRADGWAYGLDVRVEMEREPFYLFLGYGWSEVSYKAAKDDLGAWVEGNVVEYSPPHDRRHQLNLTASYEIGKFTGSASWEVASGRPYTKVAAFDLELDFPEQYPTSNPGTAQLFYDRPYNARLPPYHRLDLSLERSFDLTPRLAVDAQVGAINSYDRSNIFYFDLTTLNRVNQAPLLPYLSLQLNLN